MTILRAVKVLGVLAVFAIVATLSCRPTHLIPIFVYDASINVGDTSPVVDVAPMDAPDGGDVPVTDGGAAELPPNFQCPNVMLGFATLGAVGGTTGGGAATPVVALTMADLNLYAAQNDDPMVIEIPVVINVSGQIRVKSNKTIRGTVSGAGLVGGGLYLVDVHNVIIQRLKISQPLGVDAIGVDHSTNIWIDHCDLSSDRQAPDKTFDGLVDITHAADWVTVSWTRFSNHLNVGLIGHSEFNGLEDINHLTVTYHHNWFENVNSNTPRVRFGTVHVFNNVFKDVTGNAIASVMGAQTLIEGNVFQNVKYPIETTYMDSDGGTVNERNNEFENSVRNPMLALTNWTPMGYSVVPDPTNLVATIVQQCAGTNILTPGRP